MSVLALDSFSQHVLYVRRLQRFRVRLCGETGAQLHCEPPHLVAVQVLLDQVAFPRDPCLYVYGDVWNQPRHEELHHKHHMLREYKRYIMGIDQFYALFSSASKKLGEAAALTYFHDNNKRQFSCQNMPELHGVSVLLLVAWRVAVVIISVQNKLAIDH